ncbi:hypothetical protein [Rhodovulum adriaticum]|uniref:Uncharacterized protein n=1 Tax=Rhodovulum adriaticum TaxID=35804 RepID=A0A4R2NI82_RHOAD|nr:hypothetical protein [Rhodovulum adriaticum]MBK1637111.1 hypothetical protein [Rhodovulum adriaticum]TCP20884.1 hypothetical protein EV656_1153 [Rhodovulum adriaticum]
MTNTTAILDHLCAAADILDANAQRHHRDWHPDTRDTVRTLRNAADALYQAAEAVSTGAPLDGPETRFAVAVALAKLAEAGVLSQEVVDGIAGEVSAGLGAAEVA